MDRVIVNALADCLRDDVDPLVIHHLHPLLQFLRGKRGKVITAQAVYMLFQRPDRLHQRPLKVITDAHHFARGLHLGCQCALGRDELIKRQSGDLDHAVVKRWLKAGISLAGDGVLDLIQRIAQRDLGRHLGNRIARCLTCQRGRTAYTGINFDHTVLETGRMQGKLHIASAGDTQLVDDVERGTA